jgi:hypothetical protein
MMDRVERRAAYTIQYELTDCMLLTHVARMVVSKPLELRQLRMAIETPAFICAFRRAWARNPARILYIPGRGSTPRYAPHSPPLGQKSSICRPDQNTTEVPIPRSQNYLSTEDRGEAEIGETLLRISREFAKNIERLLTRGGPREWVAQRRPKQSGTWKMVTDLNQPDVARWRIIGQSHCPTFFHSAAIGNP